MRPVTNSVVALVLAGIAVLACEKSSLDRPASTITYSARAPRPDSTGVTTRTLDSTGYVDNAGRTSEQRNRTEASGMRATETGSERPTGTPGSGTPIPVGPRTHGAQVGEGAGALGGDKGDTTGAPGDTVVARVARARCDREIACDRVGTGKSFGTSEQCMANVRERAREDVVDAACARGFDGTQLGICLNTIRQLPCDTPLDAIDAVANCQASALCAPPASP